MNAEYLRENVLYFANFQIYIYLNEWSSSKNEFTSDLIYCKILKVHLKGSL